MNWFGFSCVKCQQKLAIGCHGLCSRCNAEIYRFAYCGCCGAELTRDELRCGRCLQQEPAWQQMVIIGRYSEPLSTLIHRFKFQGQFWLDRSLARLLYLAVRNARRTHALSLPDVILPVPLHHFRHWQRGYNQTALLAKWLARWLNIPVREDLLLRTKNTHSQRGLTAKARRNNLKNAFMVQNKLKQCNYRSVCILDDVITTGSTMNEIAKQLRKMGVQHIQVWGLART
ncbi:amidophosphoribosyltransferase [Lonepinella sp. BR2882]|uniref:amidophosphoribosyltransferase n=1 Tax=Lonepinella sp. BR2882 TaxID=3095283 RepID=UPI003F6E0445